MPHLTLEGCAREEPPSPLRIRARDEFAGKLSCEPHPYPGPANPSYLVITSGASFCTGTYAGAPGTGIPFQVTPAPDTCQQNVTQSPHPSAMIAGLGDGSVRAVSPSIATSVWYNACHPYDGHVLGSAW